MSIEGFDGWEFTAGTIRAHRVWETDPLGNLTGVTFSTTTWHIGENVAECLRIGPVPGWAYGLMFKPKPLVDKNDPEHFVKCECGMWAYFDEFGNEFATSSQGCGCVVCGDTAVQRARISGVIEGYGKIVVGEKGIRAEKARILALCFPSIHDAVAGATRTAEQIGRVMDRYAELPMFGDRDEMLAAFPLTPASDFADAA